MASSIHEVSLSNFTSDAIVFAKRATHSQCYLLILCRSVVKRSSRVAIYIGMLVVFCPWLSFVFSRKADTHTPQLERHVSPFAGADAQQGDHRQQRSTAP